MAVKISSIVAKQVIAWARRNFSKEFFAYLSGRKTKDGLMISHIAYQPYVASSVHTMTLPFIAQEMSGVLGTVHSHPSGVLIPSNTDLNTFKKFPVNIIVNQIDFDVFDSNGRRIPFEIVEEPEKEIELGHRAILSQPVVFIKRNKKLLWLVLVFMILLSLSLLLF